MRNIVKAGVLLATVALAATACSSTGGTSTAGSSGTGAAGNAGAVDSATYVFLPKSLNNPYWVDGTQGHGGGGEEARGHGSVPGPGHRRRRQAGRDLRVNSGEEARRHRDIAERPCPV